MTGQPGGTFVYSYETHQRRVIEPDGTVHAARYAGSRRYFTLACAVYPMPAIDRLVHDGNGWTVTCQGCRTALAVVITCPLCRTPTGEEYGVPIPGTDDTADCARCVACGHTWGLDPAADTACTWCGGSGHTGRGTYRDPACSCREDASPTPGAPVVGRTIPLRAPLDESGLPRKEEAAAPDPLPLPSPRQGEPAMSHTVTVTGAEQRQIFDRLAPHLPSYLRKVEPHPSGIGLRFEFAPFTGREAGPTVPRSYYEDPRLTYVSESQDPTEHRLRTTAQIIIGDLYDQARTEWKDAAYVADLRSVVKDTPDRWRVYEREATALEAAYAYLRTAQAGTEWPAAISRLVDAQDRTLAAAAAFDERAEDIAQVHDKHLYAELSQTEALAQAGYPEAADWHVGDAFGGHFSGSLRSKVAALIKEQESHLVRVSRLAGLPA